MSGRTIIMGFAACVLAVAMAGAAWAAGDPLCGEYRLVADDDGQTPTRGASIALSLRGGRAVLVATMPGKKVRDRGRLPAAAALAEPESAAEAPKAREGMRILIVDDNVDAATTLGDLLVALGHEVEVTHDAEDALARAVDFRPELVLLDIGLPRIDGYEVARRLREDPRTSGLRIVALSGYGRSSDRARAAQAGFDVHLVS